MRRLILFGTLMVVSSNAFAVCPAPQYHRGAVCEESRSELWMAIGMRFDDFSLSKLVCLANQLNQTYGQRKRVMVLMFSSNEAAADYRFLNASGIPSQNKYLHAVFVRDRDKRQQYVAITPFGGPTDQRFDTRIDLPSHQPLKCRLELNGRCLLGAEEVIYPGKYTDNISGTVTLIASIEESGSVKDVRVEAAKFVASAAQNTFTAAAVKNLESWRFEKAPNRDSIRITYSYSIDSSLQRGEGDVQIRLPDQISVRFNPIR